MFVFFFSFFQIIILYLEKESSTQVQSIISIHFKIWLLAPREWELLYVQLCWFLNMQKTVQKKNYKHKMLELSLGLYPIPSHQLKTVLFFNFLVLTLLYGIFWTELFPQIQCTIYSAWNKWKLETFTLHRWSSFAKLIGHFQNMSDSCWEALVGFWPEGTGK